MSRFKPGDKILVEATWVDYGLVVVNDKYIPMNGCQMYAHPDSLATVPQKDGDHE